MKKRTSNYIHMFSRTKLRFGRLITPGQHNQIVKNIQQGHAQFVKRQSNEVTHWRTRIIPNAIVVYSKKTKSIITTLYDPLYFNKQK